MPRDGGGRTSFHFVYPWLLFLHLVGVFLFLLSHGGSASVSFRLRRERDPERIRALLDLSRASRVWFLVSFLWILATGAVLGVLGGWWRMAWFWAAIVLLFAVAFAMTPLLAMPYNQVRRALGIPLPVLATMTRKEREAPPPELEDIPDILGRVRVVESATIGFGGILVILWLMMFKPF